MAACLCPLLVIDIPHLMTALVHTCASQTAHATVKEPGDKYDRHRPDCRVCAPQKQYGPVRQLLQVRSWLHAASGFASGLFGSGDGADSTAVITKDRFMFENVGNVYLLKGGCAANSLPFQQPFQDIDSCALI